MLGATYRASFALILLVHQVQSLGGSMMGAQLRLNVCEQSSSQRFNRNGSAIIHESSGLCVTAPNGDAGKVTLELQACNYGSPAQQWAYNDSVLSGFPSPAAHEASLAAAAAPCLAWNTQGGAGKEGLNSTVGLWPCSELGFNSYFALGYPDAGAISANFSSPSNQTFSGLCVEAQPLPALPLPTIDQVRWQNNSIACFVHFNMATAAGT